MLKEVFGGHRPTHFNPNIYVKSFITSETIFWSAQNLFAPIFAIFVANEISGGGIETAATAISIFWIVRILLELFSTIFFNKPTELTRIVLVIIGLLMSGIAQLFFTQATLVIHVYIIYSFIGIGIGLASPQRNSLFSSHIDKNHETTEWGAYDIVTFIGIALSTTLGGFIATQYGFKTLFLVSGVLCLVSVIPYIFLFIKLTISKTDKKTFLRN